MTSQIDEYKDRRIHYE